MGIWHWKKTTKTRDFTKPGNEKNVVLSHRQTLILTKCQEIHCFRQNVKKSTVFDKMSRLLQTLLLSRGLRDVNAGLRDVNAGLSH